MSRRPRLGFHCPGTGNGGPWRYVHSLLKSIDLDEFDVRIFCDIAGKYEPRPEVAVVNLSPLLLKEGQGEASSSSHEKNPPPPLPQREGRKNQPVRIIAGFLQCARRLARVLAPHNLDLFHTQNTGCEEAPVAARLAGIPHIVGTFHTDSTYDLHRERDGWQYQLLERLSNRSMHRAIAVSHATSRDWRRRTFLPSPRVVTIHNGIDVERFRRQRSCAAARLRLDLPEDAFIIVGLGRLDEAKGFADLINAAAMTALPKLMVVIAGEGPLRTSLEALAITKKVKARFLGYVNDVQSVLDIADVFALPSICETFGYAMLEAMATNLPVIASDVGGIPEVLRGGAGLVLPARNPQQWAAALHMLAQDPQQRETLGLIARERVREHFNEHVMVGKTFDVYRQLLQS